MSEDALQDSETIPYRSVMGVPDGPEIDHPYLGTVKTFLSENREADLNRAQFAARVLPGLPRLMHHVPLDKRGPYKIPAGTSPAYGERLGGGNYAMCSAIAKHGGLCKGKAVNYSGFCSRHGGMLNPADRQRIDWDLAPRHIKFKYGFLKADDLDDDELARGQIRLENGSYTKNGFVSAEIYAEFKNRLFERGDVILRESYLDAVKTFAEISKNDVYEPADRLKAAEFIFTRLRGKLPDIVELRADKPFENLMMKMVGGSREESRRGRGEDAEITDYIDAEVVEELREYASSDENFLLSEKEAEEALTDDGDVRIGSDLYAEDPDRLADDFRPEPTTWTGSAGKATKDIPYEPEIRDVYEGRKKDNEDDAERKRKALLRKAHKQKIQAGLKKRKWAQSEGLPNLPVPAKMVLWEEDDVEFDDNEVSIRLEF